MSFERVGEEIFDILFRRILEYNHINYIPNFRGIDYLLSRELIFVELEDTVHEIYNATYQMLRNIIPIAQLYYAPIVIAIPRPELPELLLSPLAYFFRKTSGFNVRRELWIVLSERKLIKIIESKVTPSEILNSISRIIEIKLDKQGKLTEKSAKRLINELRKYT